MKQIIQNTADSLLQSVATITEQRDRERLESALLATFTELMPFRHIALYHLVLSELGDGQYRICLYGQG